MIVAKNIKVVPDRYLILCEGHSEVRYFQSYLIADENRDRFRGVTVKVHRPVNHSPLGLVKEAKKLILEAKKDKLPYMSVWVVFDRNGHANIASAFEEARMAKPPIKIAFSAICFEYWILLHFEKRKIPFVNGDALVHYLKQHCITDYCKVSIGYNHLKDKFKHALENAEWLHKQNESDLENGKRIYELTSYTNIDVLMQFLKDLNYP